MDHLIEVANVAELSNDDYAILRKAFLGASDSSILCNVNLFKTKAELLEDKRTKYITDKDREIGNKPAVKKGRELESLIIQKFIERTGYEVTKPEYMYHHPKYEYLAVNFDGIMKDEEGVYIPVEAKLVTRWGEKYYNKYVGDRPNLPTINKDWTIKEHIEKMAKACGIPGYYYTQVQQQILMCDTPEKTTAYGYLTVLFDEPWEDITYYIPRDNKVIQHIIVEGAKFYEQMNKERR